MWQKWKQKVKQYPEQWFNYYDFWEQISDNEYTNDKHDNINHLFRKGLLL